MMQFLTKKINNRKGFTLIELIVVIAILGILALIAIPRLAGFGEAAEKRAVEADHRIVVSAAQMYRSSTGNWPGAVSELTEYFDNNQVPASNNGTHVINSSQEIYSTYTGDNTTWTYDMGSN